MISTHSGPQVVFHYPPSSPNSIASRYSLNNTSCSSTEIKDSWSRSTKEEAHGINLKRSTQSQRAKHFDSNGTRKRHDTGNDLESSILSRFLDPTIDQDSGIDLLNADSDSSRSSGLSESELSTYYMDSSSSGSESEWFGLDAKREDDYLRKEFDSEAHDDICVSSYLDTSAEKTTESNSSPGDSNIKSDTQNCELLSSNDVSKSLLLPPEKQKPCSTSDSVEHDSNAPETAKVGSHRGSSRRTSVYSNHDANPTVEGSLANDVVCEQKIAEMLRAGKIFLDERFFEDDKFQEINKVFGFESSFLAELCSPDREMCNTRFEFTVDNLCFLGLPIHVDSNGKWRQSKRNKTNRSRSRRSNSLNSRKKRATPTRQSSGAGTKTMSTPNSIHEQKNDGKNILYLDDINEYDTTAYEKDESDNDINMFHLCFVMNPALIEYNERVDDMYQYIATRFSLILRYLQAKNSYVSRECSNILREREQVLKYSRTHRYKNGAGMKGKYLYHRILAKSSLARAITECVDKLQANQIACLELGDDKMISLQIPIQNEFQTLPNYKLNPVLRGSFLTSIVNRNLLEEKSNKINSKMNDDLNVIEDDKDDLLNYALLLLDEPSNVIESLGEFSFLDNVSSSVLRHLVKHITPTVPLKSYQYLIDRMMNNNSGNSSLETSFTGSQNSLHTSILRSCALHLMYWRYARVIVPISSKNVYTVSPLAPIQGYSNNDLVNEILPTYTDSEVLSRLHRTNDEYQKEHKPLIYQNQRQFEHKFPSLPSLATFLSMLSNGRPKYYGSLIPSREHKVIYLNALAWLLHKGYLIQLLTYVYVRVDKNIKMAVEEDLETEGLRANKRKAGKPFKNEGEVFHKASLANDSFTRRDNGGMNDNVAPSNSHDNIVSNLYKLSPKKSANNEMDEFVDPELLDMFHDHTIVLEPERATALEKRWIYKCIQDQPSDVQILFNRLVKYFNGRHAMEVIMVRENVTRHEMKKLLTSMSKYLIEVHHW